MKLIRKSGFYFMGLMMALLAGMVLDGPAQPVHAYGGYHHGGYVRTLPRHHHSVYHGGLHYYVSAGIWYRPWGPRFVVVAPPAGYVVPLLPPYYETVWVNGVPYYYANEVYYVETPNGYRIVDPPQGAPDAAQAQLPSAGKMFIYPRQGQGEKQQADDQYACHSWAVGKTGYDPTRPGTAPPDPQKRADYDRAIGACLDARGYTVK